MSFGLHLSPRCLINCTAVLKKSYGERELDRYSKFTGLRNVPDKTRNKRYGLYGVSNIDVSYSSSQVESLHVLTTRLCARFLNTTTLLYRYPDLVNLCRALGCPYRADGKRLKKAGLVKSIMKKQLTGHVHNLIQLG